MTFRSETFRSGEDTSRQVIDIAVGILIGLRGCSRREAFDELVRVMNQTRVGVGSLAAGLVALATDTPSSQHAEAFAAWGDLIRHARPAPLASAV